MVVAVLRCSFETLLHLLDLCDEAVCLFGKFMLFVRHNLELVVKGLGKGREELSQKLAFQKSPRSSQRTHL